MLTKLGARARFALLFLASTARVSNAFYLPGVAPHDYAVSDPVPLYVNSLTPMSNQEVKSGTVKETSALEKQVW